MGDGGEGRGYGDRGIGGGEGVGVEDLSSLSSPFPLPLFSNPDLAHGTFTQETFTPNLPTSSLDVKHML